MDTVKIEVNTNDTVDESYIDTKKYVEETFKTKRPEDILRLTKEDPYHIVDTDILDFKLIQLFQLNNIIPVAILHQEPGKIKTTSFDFPKYYYNLDEKKIYRSATGDMLEILGLIFFDVCQKPVMDSKFQRKDFSLDFDLAEKKISKFEFGKSAALSATDLDSKIVYFSDVPKSGNNSDIIDKIIDLSNYLLSTTDIRIRLRKDILTSELTVITSEEATKFEHDLYNIISLFDYYRLDTKLLFENTNMGKKDAMDTLHQKIETKLFNYTKSVNDIFERDKANYYRSLCKTAYVRKFGIDAYNKLPRLKTVESTFNNYPIIPDILPLLDKKVAQIIIKEVDIITQNNLIDTTLYSKNKKIIQLANDIKTDKFPDRQWRNFKDMVTQLGLNLENPFSKDPNWIIVDGIKVLCRHYYVSMMAAKKQLSTEETHKKLLEFVESDRSEFCKICSEVLTYRDKFEGVVSTFEADSFKSSYDDTFKLIQRSANIWVRGYLVNTYNDNDYVSQAISKNIAHILYEFLKPVHDKLLSQKNKNPLMVLKKFYIYTNTYVGAAIIKIIEDNSKHIKLYGLEKIDQNTLTKGVFDIIKKIIGEDIYLFEDISEEKIEQGIKNAYKTLTDAISKVEYRERAKVLDYDPYKYLLRSLNKNQTIPKNIEQLVDIVGFIKKNNVLYDPITVQSEDKLRIEYTDIYRQYLSYTLTRSDNINRLSYRYWVTSTLLAEDIKREAYDLPDEKQNLNIMYGITFNLPNLRKIENVKQISRSENIHKHEWIIPVWGKKNAKWNGTISDSSITIGSEGQKYNLSYLDSLCKICGKSFKYPGNDDMTQALEYQNDKSNFYRYFRFICPKDGSDHQFELVKESQKCTKCGLQLDYIKEQDEQYYHKYRTAYEKDNRKKNLSVDLTSGSISTKKEKNLEPKNIDIDPKFSAKLAEELSEKMIQDKGKRNLFMIKLLKLGNTEGVLYDSKEQIDPNRTARGITLDYYLLKIIGIIGMARRSELRDLSVPKIVDITNLGIKYEKFSQPLAQYNNILSIIGKISKIDNKFATYILDNLFLSDQHNSKLEKNKEAEIQSNISYEQADQTYVDLDNSDSDIIDFKADNMFSYEGMDYDGYNEEN